jgi:hypothetical protein
MDEHVAYLRRLFVSGSEFEAGVRDLIAYCQSIAPEAPWNILDDVDYNADSQAFGGWIGRNVPAGSVPDAVKAYYFGLSEDGTSVHLDGCAKYDGADETCEWACSWVYRPDEDWADSEALDAFSRISEAADGDIPILLYLLCLGFAGLLAQTRAPGTLWRAAETQRPVAVGFDAGDAYVVLRPQASAD